MDKIINFIKNRTQNLFRLALVITQMIQVTDVIFIIFRTFGYIINFVAEGKCKSIIDKKADFPQAITAVLPRRD